MRFGIPPSSAPGTHVGKHVLISDGHRYHFRNGLIRYSRMRHHFHWPWALANG
jgi:hypothetical protein